MLVVLEGLEYTIHIQNAAQIVISIQPHYENCEETQISAYKVK